MPSWTTSVVGDAFVSSGLWLVCTENVPYIVDGCDGVLEPSSTLLAARFLAVGECVIGFGAIVMATVTVIVLPYSIMLLLSALVTALALALGVLTVVVYMSSAHPVVLSSDQTRYAGGFLVLNAGWVLFLLALALMLHAYTVKRREAAPAKINRKGWAAAKRAGRAMGRAAGGKR